MKHRKDRRDESFEAKMAKAYKKCLEWERKRNYRRRRTRQGAFESGFVRYEQLLDNPEAAKDKLRCAGTLAAVISDPDDQSVVLGTKAKLDHACEKLKRHGLGHLVRTLRLIARNGSNREESIWQLMRDAMRRQDTATMKTEHISAPFSGSKTGSKSTHPEKN